MCVCVGGAQGRQSTSKALFYSQRNSGGHAWSRAGTWPSGRLGSFKLLGIDFLMGDCFIKDYVDSSPE